MDSTTFSIVMLGLLFLGAFVPRFSLALAVFPASLLVATVAGVSVKDLFGFFPTDVAILIIGVTALFAVADKAGTIDWILGRALQLIGSRTVLIPLLIFTIGALITALGTSPPAAIAIMAPIALGLALRRGLPPMLMCLMLLSGIYAGCFSPIAVFGATVPRFMAKAGIDVPARTSPALLLASLGTGLVICGAAMVVARRSLFSPNDPSLENGGNTTPPATTSTPNDPPQEDEGGTTPPAHPAATTTTAIAPTAIRQDVPVPAWSARAATITALVLLVIGGVGFDMNLGLLGLALAFLLQLVLRIEPVTIIRRLPWEIILLISGLLTYVGLMQHIGAIDQISRALQFAGSPMLSLLAVCFITGVVSFFVSSLAVVATAVPLIAPLVATGGVSPVGAIIAVSLSAVLVDINPMGITGGLLLGSAAPEHRSRLFRQLTIYGLCSIVLGPLFAWAIFGSL